MSREAAPGGVNTFIPSEATMDRNTGMLIGMAAIGVLALITFAVYRWRQRERVRQIDQWVRDFLVRRYGEMPNDLHVNCSDDTLWPVLVSFVAGANGIRHRLQFLCAGPASSFVLVAEKEDAR
jgi:hypothetical protein